MPDGHDRDVGLAERRIGDRQDSDSCYNTDCHAIQHATNRDVCMKPMMITAACLLVGFGSADSTAASLLMDDFTGSGFTLGSSASLPSGNQSSTGAPIPAWRSVFGQGGPDWMVTLDPAAGTLTYSFDVRRGLPGAVDFLGMIYSYGQSLESIAGLNTVRLRVDSVVGSGTVSAVVAVGPIMEEQPVLLNGTGDLEMPLVKPSLPDASARIGVRIYPTTPNFSVTLSSLWLVPEPGVGLLAAAAGGWLASRRRRET